MRYRPNERAGGTGGFASLFHTVHSWSALPQHGAFRKHLRMYLNKQELLLLKFYQKYRSKDPTLPSLLMRPLLNLVVLLGFCLGIWLLATAPGGSREWGWGVIGLLSGLTFNRFNNLLRVWQRWPLMREILNWQKVDELVQQRQNPLS